MEPKRVLAIGILVIQGTIALALALVGLILNVFFASGVDVDTYPWWGVAARSLAESLVPVAVFAGVAWIVNATVVRAWLHWNRGAAWKVSVAVFIVAASGSVVGALIFGWTKPHM